MSPQAPKPEPYDPWRSPIFRAGYAVLAVTVWIPLTLLAEGIAKLTCMRNER